MSLDKLAEYTGVSKSMLGQIERGESNPTITTISKIIEGIHVPLEDLISEPEEAVHIYHRDDLEIYQKYSDQYKIYLLSPYDKKRGFEVYQAIVAQGCSFRSHSLGTGTKELVTVVKGQLTLHLQEKDYVVNAGDSIRFSSEKEHEYESTGLEELELNIILELDIR